MPTTATNRLLKLKTNIDTLKPPCIELITGNCKLMTASTAAALAFCTAVASAEQFAAFASFQWQEASLSPTQNANSAPFSLTFACHFSGNNANYAANATTTATYSIF